MNEDRIEALGFSPQKELAYNRLLPYSESIDEESNAILSDIKGNLGKAIQLRDLKSGVRHWIVQLERYIAIYGYKFSKADHILLVQVVFDLLTIPSKEYALIEKLASTLCILLKKRHLLSRDDLTLPWRPLYAILEDYTKEGCGCKVYPAKFDVHIRNVTRACSKFFHEDSTQEMLDEWRPYLCPFDMVAVHTLQCLDIFLPTCLPPELHHKGFKLWFKEVMQIWQSFQSMPSWEASVVGLLSRLAHDNIGYIDWTPYIPEIFTRLLRSFCLPVGTSQMVPNRNHNVYEVSTISLWIVSMMGGKENIVQTHITKLFKALHSFYHPSNAGRWTLRLGAFLQTLPKMFFKRLRRERYKELTWLPPVPDEVRLSDAEVTEFCESLKSSVFVAMFSKFGSQDASMALRHLAALRPEIFVPPLLEKMYPALETLIEPHRLIACMICIVSVARPMLTSPKYYPEGPSHVLPLLNMALPGIDANDFKKTLVTLQMVSTFVTLVPIVDCSEAVHVIPDLTELERDLCSATAQFEDFVLCFIDRVHSLIENSSQEASYGNLQEKLTMEQSVLEMGLASTVSAMLQQCSTVIYMSALKKIHNFVTSNVFEVKVSGKLAANLCRAAIRIHPEVALKMFIPQFCANIEEFLKDHPAAYDDEDLDNHFLWNLLLLSHAVRCDGAQLLPYKTELLSVIGKVLKLKCVQGYEIGGQLLKNTLKVITQLYPLEFRSVEHSFDCPFTEHLAIKEWGKSGNLDTLTVQWHQVTEPEVEMAQEIVTKILEPELELFHSISANNQISKEDFLRRLNIVSEFIGGAGAMLPPWEDDTNNTISLVESQVPLERFSCSVRSHEKNLTLKGKNIREVISDAMSHLLEYLSESREDDTKNLFLIIKIYELLLLYFGTAKNEFDGRWKSFNAVKHALGNSMATKRSLIRALLIDRMQLQHELRQLNFCARHFTKRHQDIITSLFNLSISRYREVRKKAQATLHGAFQSFAYSYLTCLMPIVDHLRNPQVEEHVFKGCLHVILRGKSCLATKRNWKTLSLLWPALVQAQQFEKPSILKVIEDIMNRIIKSLDTFAVSFETTQEALASAGRLLSAQTVPLPSRPNSSEAELLEGLEFENRRNTETLESYNKLHDELLDLIESGSLTWKFNQTGFEFLSLIVIDDIQPSARMVALFTKNCTSDLVYIRKLAISTISSILDIQKQRFHKLPVDLEKVAGVGKIDHANLIPGDRPDNRWLQYDPDEFISTEEEWNNKTFVEKTHWGYYSWPKELKVVTLTSDQPNLHRSRDELPEAEVPLFDYFQDEHYVEKLFEFLALEEDKNSDKYRHYMLIFFKCLYRNFGDTFLEKMRPHIERLITDTSHDKHSSSQRCALEVLSGIIKASKYWSFSKLSSLWDWVIPLLEKGLNNLTVETLNDWGSFFMCISENRDPRRLQWVYRLLLGNPLSGEGGAFGDSARLYILQQAILQQEWRIPDYLHLVVNYLQPHLAHPYKSVRDKIGSLLSSCMQMDYVLCPESVTRSPRRIDLVNHVLPQLNQFQDFVAPDKIQPSTSQQDPEEQGMVTGELNEEQKAAVRVCKTVIQWMATCIQRSLNPCPDGIFKLLPIMDNLQSEANDEDLREDCKIVVRQLSMSLIPSNKIDDALASIKEITGYKSWRTRVGVLSYMQQMVFGNFFTLQGEHHKREVQGIVLHLLCDEQLEVREFAAITLSGMIHCGYVTLDKDLLDHFERLRSTKVKVRQAQPVPLQRLIQRHAGVLGLSACVQAYPYDVPDFIPQVLVDLSVHVNDPQPIGMTVTKTLSNFRRTHHDNWHDHKRMFTDDQLVTLTDLLISPNYYA